MSDETIDPENFTNEHRDKLVQRRAQEALQAGRGIGGGISNDTRGIIQALAEGKQVVALKSEHDAVKEILGTKDLPETVEERKRRERTTPTREDFEHN